MKCYVETKQSEKARKTMDQLTRAAGRSRKLILDTLEHYEKLDPRHAEEIRQKLNEIMAGPVL